MLVRTHQAWPELLILRSSIAVRWVLTMLLAPALELVPGKVLEWAPARGLPQVLRGVAPLRFALG